MKAFLFTVAIAALLSSGCTTPSKLTAGLLRTSVMTGVQVQTLKNPDALPYLKASAVVVCSSAAGTNISPAAVVAALESAPESKLKTPEAIIIMNGVLSLYTALYEEYFKDPEDAPAVRDYLQAICDGLTAGTAHTPVPAAARERSRPAPRIAIPHIK